MLVLQKEHSEQQAIRSEMFTEVCRALDDAGARWCVVCGHTAYPEDVKPHDVDILVEEKRFGEMAAIFARVSRLNVAQCIKRESTAIRYETVSYASDGAPVLLSFDIFSDVRYPGGVLMDGEDFLQGRTRCRDLFWIPRPAVEFTYYLLKKLEKSSRLGEQEFAPSHGERLCQLYSADPVGSRRELAKLLDKADVELVATAACNGTWQYVLRERVDLYESMLRNAARQRTLGVLRYWLRDLSRRVERICRPTGMLVVFRGNGGAVEQATIKDWLEPLAPQAFRRITFLATHTRVGLRELMAGLWRSSLVVWASTNEPPARIRQHADVVINVNDLGAGELGIEVQRRILDSITERTSRRGGVEW
jgi:hypothetical protein